MIGRKIIWQKNFPDQDPESSAEFRTRSCSYRETPASRGALVLPADDVIDLAAPKRVVLMEEAVFADVVGALGHLLTEPLTYLTGHERGVGGRGLWPAA